MTAAPRISRKAFVPDAPGALDGVRVVDLSRLVAGNVLTQQLADFGAEVIKVEPPEGDTLRGWRVEGVETAWKMYSRNKKSVCLELRKPEAQEIVAKLADSAAMLVESFRPGVLEDMGLGPDALLKRNPKLVIVRISGWGQDGPFRHKPGFGTLIEGYTGFAALNGFADREPVLPPMYLADTMAGYCGAAAALTALRAAEAPGGRGQVVDLALFEPLFAALGPQVANWRLTGRVKARTGSRSTNAAPRNVYRTSDGGWACLSASTQGMTEKLLRSIGRPDLIDDPKFRTNQKRVENGAELDEIIGGFIAGMTLDETCAFFDKAGVTIGPVNDVARIAHDRYILERGALIETADADMGAMPMHDVTPRLSGTPGALRSPAPTLGEHTAAVLTALVGAAEYERLAAAGTARTAAPRAPTKAAS